MEPAKKAKVRDKLLKNSPSIIQLVVNGDLRESANQVCWPAQKAMEERLTQVFANYGFTLKRMHSYSEQRKHGFIASQKEGMKVFAKVDPLLPIVVAESVWQYSHHILHGLVDHKGPILTVANWSGQWPGLVGMLNLNGCLTKAGVDFSTVWSETFEDEPFLMAIKKWLGRGRILHPVAHVAPLKSIKMPARAAKAGAKLAAVLKREKAIMGVFDEGCMGMYNAIIPDELLFSTGVYKERLSQSALYAGMLAVSDKEAADVLKWLKKKGFNFHFGTDEATELTEAQVLQQCKMYIAACRIGDEFGCEAIGIQYQQGLKDLCPASDLVEGILNNSERPPVKNAAGAIIRDGKPFTHFNEVDECAGLDGILTQRVHEALGQPVENTLHDLRWGDFDASGTTDEYVWVFEISGGAPPAHHVGGYKGTHGYRQPAMYFKLGGATCSGVAKPGEIIWSRIFIADGKLKMDIGRGKAITLPDAETQRRLDCTTPVWPIMHGVTYGVSRDQMMARHPANHIQIAYANSADEADQVMFTKAAMAAELGMEVSICGTDAKGKDF